MHKIVVFGGTGMTGQYVVQQALKKGLNVSVLFRNEATVPESFKGKVDLVKGDVTNLEDVKMAVRDVDAVVIVLGTRNKLDPTTVLSTGTSNIIQAMDHHGISKVSLCLSSFLFWDENKIPTQFVHINNEHKKMLELIEKSDLKYVAVLPPHISDEPSTEVAIVHDASPGRIVPKLDLATFLLECLEDERYYCKKWGIAKKV